MKASALLVAGVFVLSGCGSSEGKSESASAETKSASATPTPTLAVGQEQYTADELEDALTAVKEAEGLTGQIANDAMVRPELGAAEDALAGIAVTPEACGELLTNGLGEKLNDGVFGIMQLSATDTVTIISYTDESFIEEQIKSNNQQLEDCSTFTMEANGQSLAASGKEVEATTDAPTTQAVEVMTSMGGDETTALQIAALSGTTNITVAVQDPADTAAAVADAEEIINAVLAELEKK
ncbi:hypothetical protein N2K95_05455 [Arthrobacter zhaoxinii]|uniref:PknH-like extracellular domain-containing protein n=1 Tax=Arthrobacter zhaoxinii TaxID=2964616 RepID=A0ABY5YVL9_9MICC|nr:hypothetical protein [Arthrobacter zhaoxinii]UWX98113.1 hypothetical protein N2K95_05455 [Arthrobacter zhaoxinii]